MEIRVPIVSRPVVLPQPVRPFSRSLEGAVLGVLDNQKQNSTRLVEAVIARLTVTASLKGVLRAQKSPPLPAPDIAFERLSSADVVLVASAD